MILEGSMKGYLAFQGKMAVGWCNVNNRQNYQRLAKLYNLVDAGHPRICSVVCFLIDPEHRRKGITKLFLRAIEEDYGSQGYEYIEAYPGKGDLSTEKQYKGPLDLYLEHGFRIIREDEEYYTVRKMLHL
jgi:ribosomal protein S18 acetylase RimI-like enzyme